MSTSPYRLTSLAAVSPAPIVPAIAMPPILPVLAIFAHGTKNVTGSAIAVPILPPKIVRSSSSSETPLNSRNSLRISCCLSASTLRISSLNELSLKVALAPALAILYKLPAIMGSCAAP